MKVFLIQSKKIDNFEITAQDFGRSIIDVIEYHNWFRNNNEYSFILCENITQDIIREIYLKGLINYIPVGSIEFCLYFYSKFGIKNIIPINVPEKLKDFVKRKCYFDYNVYHDKLDLFDKNNDEKLYMVKSKEQIKSKINGFYSNKCIDILSWSILNNYFVSKYIDNVCSEWRVFVYNKRILGLKCYSGDEWILPDKKYIEEIVNFYDRESYTLDVMITENGLTDILELHQFFSCGLYGFNHPELLNMMISTHMEIIEGV